ncbi:MAG: hypothetical protein HFF73_09940 [Oscillospiraceae bacterium]|nr:hypothetical protein [Oscillospiraceae bacterium]
MLGGISGVSSYSTYYMNMNLYRNAARTQGALPRTQQAPEAPRTGGASGNWTLGRSSGLGTPVQPVDPVKRVNPDAQPAGIDLPLNIRQGADPAEMAVRMRIRPYEDDAAAPGGDAAAAPGLDGEAQGAEAVQEALEEGECETCEKRKYQDGSDDMSVSFQTPTNIKPEQVASAVRGHEMEHVVHEQAKAQREDRKVVSQSVTLHTDICPECGKVYISGGETRTVTKANPEPVEDPAQEGEEDEKNAASVLG